MKAVATWILVAGGIMIGLVIITLTFSIAANIFRGQQEANALSQFSDLVNRAEAICTASEGNVDFMRIGIPEITRAIYPGSAKFSQPPDKVSDLITDEAEGSGNYLCLQFFDNPEPRCRQISCRLRATYIGSPSLKDDLFSLVSKLAGSSPVYEYFVTIEKLEGEVKITAQKVISERPVLCELESLPAIDILGVCTDSKGKEKPVLIMGGGGKVAVYGDVFPWISDNPDFAQLVKSLGSNVGGRALIIWENDNAVSTGAAGVVTTPGADPKTKANIAQAFTGLGNSINTDTFRRTGKITDSLLAGYGQAWLIRSGFCNVYAGGSDDRKRATGCLNVPPFSDDEIDAIGRFVSGGGKLLLITDSPTIADTTGIEAGIVNRILEKAHAEFKVSRRHTCESSIYRQKSSALGSTPASIPVKYSIVFDCG